MSALLKVKFPLLEEAENYGKKRNLNHKSTYRN